MCTCIVTGPVDTRIRVEILDFEINTRMATFTVGNGFVIGESEILTRKNSYAIPEYVTSQANHLWISFNDERNDTVDRSSTIALFSVELSVFLTSGMKIIIHI